METHYTYKGWGITYTSFDGTTTLATPQGFPSKVFYGGEIEGDRQARMHIDFITEIDRLEQLDAKVTQRTVSQDEIDYLANDDECSECKHALVLHEYNGGDTCCVICGCE